MKNRAKFKSYNADQLFLLPPDMKDWLPEDDLIYFIMDVVGSLDLDRIYEEARGFRRFSFRGLEHCQGEWDLVCLTHNLLKLFRYGKWKPRIA